MAQSHSDQVEPATDYEHESACPLINDHARVAERFVGVFETLEAMTDAEVDWGAAGCNGCFHSDADIVAYWVAQHDAVESMWVGYGGAAGQAAAAGHIMAAANECDVPVSWDGDTARKIKLGEEVEG